ncbi:MAG: hypothetical protein JW993_11950 [Sedimentisphaerales bacterium]|nr:hypothetical protein [Sedimentisphaerales bacterium]
MQQAIGRKRRYHTGLVVRSEFSPDGADAADRSWPLNPSRQRAALRRLDSAPLKSDTTEAASRLVCEGPSQEKLTQALKDCRQGPVALEALCALRPTSDFVYQAVLRAIDRDSALGWSLIESLNHLPWHDGLRAFLSLPEDPVTSAHAYGFCMLARNKVFYPTDMSGVMYAYHVNGLWALLPTARSGNWRQAHPSAFAIVELLHRHLSSARPDKFVVYFSALMLGGIGPLPSCIEGLQARTRQRCLARLRETAALTLTLLDGEDDGAPPAAWNPA